MKKSLRQLLDRYSINYKDRAKEFEFVDDKPGEKHNSYTSWKKDVLKVFSEHLKTKEDYEDCLYLIERRKTASIALKTVVELFLIPLFLAPISQEKQMGSCAWIFILLVAVLGVFVVYTCQRQCDYWDEYILILKDFQSGMTDNKKENIPTDMGLANVVVCSERNEQNELESNKVHTC